MPANSRVSPRISILPGDSPFARRLRGAGLRAAARNARRHLPGDPRRQPRRRAGGRHRDAGRQDLSLRHRQRLPGGDGWAGDYNAGRDTILPYLKGRGIASLDGVIISHAHYDHFGGLLWLADHFPVARLYDAGYKFPGESSAAYAEELAAYDRLRDKFKARPGAYVEAHTGDHLDLDPRLDVEVTAPPKGFFTEPHPEQRPKSDPPAHYLVNANSLGIRIKHGDVVFLLPGDIQKEDQIQSLLPSIAAEKLRCQILVAPGHGIHAVPEFAAAAHPEVTIASVFPRYAKSIPAPKVYGAVGSRVFVTGLHGRVTVTSDGKAYELDVERPDGAAPMRNALSFMSLVFARITPAIALCLCGEHAVGRPRARGAHSEITAAAIQALARDATPSCGGWAEMRKKLPEYAWMADWRTGRLARSPTSGSTSTTTSCSRGCRATSSTSARPSGPPTPFFRRALQALRTETPVNAARPGSARCSTSPRTPDRRRTPPRSWATSTARWRTGRCAGHHHHRLPATTARELDDEVLAGFLRRMDGLIAFSRERFERAWLHVLAGNRAATEPIVLESALERRASSPTCSRTLGHLAEAPQPGTARLRGTITSPPAADTAKVPAKAILLGTNYSTLAGPGRPLRIPPGAARSLHTGRFGPGTTIATTEIVLTAIDPTTGDITLSAAPHGSGLGAQWRNETPLGRAGAP